MTGFPIGLMLATATSMSNVLMDVTRKKALSGHDLFRTTFWIRFTVAAVLTLVLALRWWSGMAPAIHPDPTAASFSIGASAPVSYLAYLLADTALVSLAVLLYYRAVQASPLWLTIPFLAFTPVFLLLTGHVILGRNTASAEMRGGWVRCDRLSADASRGISCGCSRTISGRAARTWKPLHAGGRLHCRMSE